jgi:hypothetical protein
MFRNIRADKDIRIFTPAFVLVLVLVLESAGSRTRTRTRTRTIRGDALDHDPDSCSEAKAGFPHKTAQRFCSARRTNPKAGWIKIPGLIPRQRFARV